jgi:tetratricopeptide (TPR) repeat protein
MKVLRPELAAALGPERFLQEIKIAANLHHPHILPLYDSGEADGFLYYVMPLVEGESLRDRLDREKQLAIDDALQVAREVADALSYAHSHGVIHRDIKPENILLESGHAVVADFGIARAVDAAGGDRLTETGIAIGTPAYMSPEQAGGEKDLDGRSDLYSLGCVLHEMLAGQPPFTGPTVESLVHQHLTAEPPNVTTIRPSVPGWVAAALERSLAKTPADRFNPVALFGEAISPRGVTAPAAVVAVDRRVKRRWMVAGGAVAVAAIIAVIAVVAAIPRGSVVALDSDRIVVAVFRNETGDPLLDQVGRQAGHWITHGLQQTGIVQVVPWETALQSSQYVIAEAEAGRVRDRVQALAEETGAATVISGAYYRRGDAIQYQLEITDAGRGRLLAALNPQDAPLEAPDEAMEPLRQQVLGFLAISLDERISAQASGVVRPPSYEAYRAFDEGMRYYFRLEYREALPYFYQAFELDSTFVTPITYAILCHYNREEWAQADSLVGILGRYRDRLSEYDRHWLDYLTARVDGDWTETLRAIRRAAELAPGSNAVYEWALVAMRSNRPQEAVDALLSLDPERGPMRGWPSYYVVLAHCYLMLDQFETALDAVRRARSTSVDDAQRLAYEAFALAGLGRITDVSAVVNQMVDLPGEDMGQGYYVRRIAVYLRRHGYADAAQATIDRSIEWYEGRSPEAKSSTSWRYFYAIALYVADRCDESYGVVKPLSQEFPEDYDYRGVVGMVAACRGDREEALEASRWLEVFDRPYLYGRNALYRSAIAAALGDGESAVTLWQQARAEGLWLLATTTLVRMMGPGDGRWIAYEPLHDYPPFQELIRPKG